MKNHLYCCVNYSCDHRALVSCFHCIIIRFSLRLYRLRPASPLWRARSSKRTRGEGTGTRAVQPSLLRIPLLPSAQSFFFVLTSRSVQSDERNPPSNASPGQWRRGGGGPYANVLAGETQRFIHLLPVREVSYREGYFTWGAELCRTKTLPWQKLKSRGEALVIRGLFFFPALQGEYTVSLSCVNV